MAQELEGSAMSRAVDPRELGSALRHTGTATFVVARCARHREATRLHTPLTATQQGQVALGQQDGTARRSRLPWSAGPPTGGLLVGELVLGSATGPGPGPRIH